MHVEEFSSSRHSEQEQHTPSSPALPQPGRGATAIPLVTAHTSPCNRSFNFFISPFSRASVDSQSRLVSVFTAPLMQAHVCTRDRICSPFWRRCAFLHAMITGGNFTKVSLAHLISKPALYSWSLGRNGAQFSWITFLVSNCTKWSSFLQRNLCDYAKHDPTRLISISSGNKPPLVLE